MQAGPQSTGGERRAIEPMTGYGDLDALRMVMKLYFVGQAPYSVRSSTKLDRRLDGAGVMVPVVLMDLAGSESRHEKA